MTRSTRILLFVALAYFAQGIAEHFCLLAQPVSNYLLKVKHWDAAQVASYLGLLMIPWTIKPLYGIVTDLVFPATKRFYLTLTFILALVGYGLSCVDPSMMLLGFMLAGAGLSWGTALLCGLVVKSFDGEGIKRVFSWQAISYYVACTAASYFGGQLCHHLSAENALHMSFGIAAIVCAVGAAASAFLLKGEAASREPAPGMVQLKEAIWNRNFLMVALFILCWNFSPGFGTPLYFHYTNVLHFSQAEIGQFNASNAAGMLVGAWIFPWFSGVTRTKQVYAAVGLYIVCTLSFCAVSTAYSAIALEFLRGIATMLGLLTIYCLVAKVCRPNLETLITSLLIAVYNLATQMSGVLGGFLYVHAFHNTLWQLLIVSSTITAACMLLVRFLPEEPSAREEASTTEEDGMPAINVAPELVACRDDR